MDIADDIAYSIFDLEDTFKANFLSPMNFLAVIEPVLKKVHEKVTDNEDLKNLSENDVLAILHHCISPYLNRDYFTELEGVDLNNNEGLIYATGLFYRTSTKLNNDGYTRYQFTSAMIDEFIEGVTVELNSECPALSEIRVDRQVKTKIECIKHFVYYSITMSNRLRIPEYRGYEIVCSIFKILDEVDHNPGYEILLSDFLEIYHKSADEAHKKRTICDYVAGMTDRYVIEFYGRLKSENPETIFKPI